MTLYIRVSERLLVVSNLPSPSARAVPGSHFAPTANVSMTTAVLHMFSSNLVIGYTYIHRIHVFLWKHLFRRSDSKREQIKCKYMYSKKNCYEFTGNAILSQTPHWIFSVQVSGGHVVLFLLQSIPGCKKIEWVLHFHIWQFLVFLRAITTDFD